MNLPAIKRGYLIVMLIVIGLATAICGGTMVFAGWRGLFMDAILLVALDLGYLLMISLVCFISIEKKRWRSLAWAGLVLSAVVVLLVPIYIYLQEIYPPWLPDGQWLDNLVASYLFIIGYLAFVPLVLLPRMNIPGRMLQIMTVLCISGFLIFILGMVWDAWRSFGHNHEQIYLALLTFSGGGALGVFVLNKFFAIKPVEQLREVTHTLTARCPRCLSTQELPVGESNCRHCKLHFKIEVEEPRCRNCQYILRGLTRPICPECGTVFREEELVQAEANGLPPIPSG